jgi:hypothetical protein
MHVQINEILFINYNLMVAGLEISGEEKEKAVLYKNR